MHLMIVLDDRLSDWETKGEVLKGYFNPAGAFDRITVVSILQDNPPAELVQKLTSPAKAEFISLGMGRPAIALRTLGMSRWRLTRFFKPLLDLCKIHQPDLVRSFGESLGTVTANLIKTDLGIPYIISLHTTPAPHITKHFVNTRDKAWRRMMRRNIHQALENANGIIAVYTPILDHLPPRARARAVVIPNVVDTPDQSDISAAARSKTDETLRVLWVGRLIPGRNPDSLLKAIASLRRVTLTIIGDGPLRDEVRETVQTLGIRDRVTIIPRMDNAKLVRSLPSYHVMALHTYFQEISKPVLEAGLAGLPVILNETACKELTDFNDLAVIFVEDSPAGYTAALGKILHDPTYRCHIAEQFKKQAWARWAPKQTEQQAAELMMTLAKKYMEKRP